jgi:type II protein arginine methyltransferase
MASLEIAIQQLTAGRLDDAVETLGAVLAENNGDAEANHLLGLVLFRQGRNHEACAYLAKAVAAPGAPAEMHNNYGGILNTLGDAEGARRAFERALALKPDYADALNNLGVVLRDSKRTEEAIAAFQRAIAADPRHTQARANLRAAYRDVVPAWHFAMMDDGPRNAAYEAAIARAVPGKRVLDIGTGAGLLAMMAARAGAASVATCEGVGLIAGRAKEIVTANGLSDRIGVISQASTDIAVGRDMPARAQVLITETFASNVIGEGILPTIEDAHERLIEPGAAIIPASACAMGYLVGGETLKGLLFVGRVRGFDLSAFNDFAPPTLSLLLDQVAHEVLSAVTELMRFDFRERRFPMANRRVEARATRIGEALGIAQWIRLELDAETVYDNRPAPGAPFNGHWSHVLYRFPHPVPVAPGDVVALDVRHDRNQISVDLAP